MANDPRFETYSQHDAKGEKTGDYGWRFRDSNGHVTFIGGEGFTRREDAHRSIEGVVADVVRAVMPGAEALTIKVPPIIDVE